MPYRRSCAACALAAALLLSGCSAVTGSDVELSLIHISEPPRH